MSRRTYRYRGRWNRRARNAAKLAVRRREWIVLERMRSGRWTRLTIAGAIRADRKQRRPRP